MMGKDKGGARPSLLRIEEMSASQITDFVMDFCSEGMQCDVVGDLPWEHFRGQSYDARYKQVRNAVEQMPLDILAEILALEATEEESEHLSAFEKKMRYNE